MANVELRQVRKTFGGQETIAGVDLDIRSGEFMVLVGPSGCGKSTLLRMIAGLEEISAGTLAIAGADVTDLPPAKRGVAMVFQSYALYPHMTVYENMAFGLSLAGQSRAAVHERVQRAAAILQLEPLLQRLPKALSGGQRQRVAIGRAIVRQPKVFLFDEPLSNLDAGLRVQMRIELARLHAELGTTMVYVTHDQVEAMTLADRIAVINRGRIEQLGAPLDLYHHPRNQFVATFLGSPRMNLLAATVPAAQGGVPAVHLPGGALVALSAALAKAAPPGPVTLGIRPEHVELVAAGPQVPTGRVVVIEHLGNETFAHVALDGTNSVDGTGAGTALLVLRLDAASSVARGDALGLRFAPERLHLFDASGRSLLDGARP
ncbi:MAG: transporter [Pseudomonadota bacterium]